MTDDVPHLDTDRTRLVSAGEEFKLTVGRDDGATFPARITGADLAALAAVIDHYREDAGSGTEGSE